MNLINPLTQIQVHNKYHKVYPTKLYYLNFLSDLKNNLITIHINDYYQLQNKEIAI